MHGFTSLKEFKKSCLESFGPPIDRRRPAWHFCSMLNLMPSLSVASVADQKPLHASLRELNLLEVSLYVGTPLSVRRPNRRRTSPGAKTCRIRRKTCPDPGHSSRRCADGA